MDQALSARPNPQAMWAQANRFRIAADLQHQWASQSRKGGEGIPAAMLSAFTIELYLKLLLVLESKRIPRTHKLHVLFQNLSPAMKALVTRLWNDHPQGGLEIGPIMPPGVKAGVDLAAKILEANDTFERLRYIFEGRPGQPFGFAIGALPSVLDTIVRQMKPDWTPPES